VFENRMLRKMFRPKGVVEVTWEWRKLCNEVIHNWYYSLVIVSRGLGGRGMQNVCGGWNEFIKSFSAKA
jgi:hypothetical protein